MSPLGSVGDNEVTMDEVVRQLLDAVWRLRDASQSSQVLDELRRGLERLALHPCAALVHLVEDRCGAPAVKFVDLFSDEGWRWARNQTECEPVIRLWQLGKRRGAGCGDADADTVAGAAQRCRADLGSALEVPFSQGVLGVYSQQKDAFGAADRLCLERLGPVLSILYHRVADLDALSAKEVELRHLQRLQLAGQLAAEVAHDLSGPMTVLAGECTLLLDSDIDPELRQAIQAISRAAEQAQTVGNRLLDFVRGHKPDKEWVNCNRLVQETLELVRRGFAKEGTALEEDLGRNLPWIQAHAGQVRQVVLNLLQNAREAVAESGRPGWVRVRTFVGGGCVVLEVEDNGPGVRADIAERIFEPFFTTKHESNGTGLGLSVCAGIANEHGGELRLEPRALGACIRVELPVRQTGNFGNN